MPTLVPAPVRQRPDHGRAATPPVAAIGPVTAALVAILVASTPAVAQEATRGDLVTDRPDATESTETIFVGGFQLETGYTFGSVDDVDSHSLGELLLRVGIARNVELRLGVNSYEWSSTPFATVSGLSDTAIGIKVKLVDADRGGNGWDVGVIASTSLPTGNDEFGAQAAQPSLLLAAARDLSDTVGLSANIGWNLANDPAADERSHELLASIAFGFGIDDHWGLFVEYFGTYVLEDGAADANFLDGGVTYLISPDLQLDARVGYGLNGRDGDFFFGVGSAVRW